MASIEAILDPVHRNLLDSAIRNVLGTERALETFAQIADGLPLCGVARDGYAHRAPYADHPAIARHTSLCPGATEAALGFLSKFSLNRAMTTEAARDFLSDFNLGDTLTPEVARDFLSEFMLGGALTFDKALLRAYQWTQPGSGRSFECRLIELVARAVHGLAAVLFKRGDRIHDVVWAAKDPAYTVNAVTRSNPDPEPDPSPFCQPHYALADQYPDGVADVVGYWAENRILGGVVLLDRSDSWDDQRNPEPNVFLHSSYYNVTFRVWRALDEQQQALVDFLLSRSRAGACPLPLLASDKNLDRIDPEYATSHKVYRDFWERRLPPSNGRFQAPHCVMSRLDYPEM